MESGRGYLGGQGEVILRGFSRTSDPFGSSRRGVPSGVILGGVKAG